MENFFKRKFATSKLKIQLLCQSIGNNVISERMIRTLSCNSRNFQVKNGKGI